MTSGAEKTELWLEWGFRALLGLVVAMLTYFGNQLHQDQIAMMDKIHSMEVWKAETGGNRFTSVDGMKLQGLMSEATVALDKRITRNEDNIASIKTQLDRIESAIEKLKQ